MLKKYDLSQCALYKCRSQRRLESLLILKKYELDKIQKLIRYHSFQIDKKDSTEKRDITAPCFDLKKIQSRILQLLEKIERPEWLISGEKGKCYIDNGKAHLQSNYAVMIDIKKFYDNCKREPVYRFIKDSLQTSGDVAGILTDIVTYNGGIPTGCPTSQIIAYYAYQNMFLEISEIAKEYNCIFTLYVDDMTFSSSSAINWQVLARKIDIILRKYGHKPKYRKVKYYSKDEPKPITGTIIGTAHNLDVPNNLRKKIYENFINIKRNTSENRFSDMGKFSSLRGQIQAAKSIDPNIFPEIDRLTKLMPYEQPIKESAK